jgi:DNA-binding LacI/PurR family transcriptional regulator
VVVHDSSDPYFVEILRGVLGPAEASGRMVIVCDTRRSPDREFKYVRHFRTQRVQELALGPRLSRVQIARLPTEVILRDSTGQPSTSG